MDSSSSITSGSCFLKNPIASFTNLFLPSLVCFNPYCPLSFSAVLFLSTCSLLFLYRGRRRLEKGSTWVKNLPRGETQTRVSEESDHQHVGEGSDSSVLSSNDAQELLMNLNVSSSDDTEELQEISSSDDSSLSDDESLIEIDLFEVDPFGKKEPKPVSLPEISPELLLRKQGPVVELPNDDINEDNLIEIDITMGSILSSSPKISSCDG